MVERLFGELTLGEILVPVLVFGASIGLAWFFQVFLVRAARRLTQKTKIKLDDAILSVLRKPVAGVIVLGGLYIASLLIPLEAVVRSYLSKGFNILFSLLGIYVVAALIHALTRWIERDLIAQKGTRSRLEDIFADGPILHVFQVATFLVAVSLGIIAVLTNLGIDVSLLTGWLGEQGWRIGLIVLLSGIGIVAVGEFVPRLVVGALARRADEPKAEITKRGNTLSRVLVGVGKVTVLFVGAFMVLSELEINITPILAGAGILGIAIGFGAQSLVRDVVTGLFIILENQYRVGDWVRIADVAGLVEDINLKRTVLRDFDGTVHSVPNGEVRVSSNFTKEWSRINMSVSVAYGEDLDHVISVINRVGKELAEDPQWVAGILAPPQALGVDKLGDSGIEIRILGEAKAMRPWAIMRELRLRLKKAFDKDGIEIPWPHMKVYFGNSSPSG